MSTSLPQALRFVCLSAAFTLSACEADGFLDEDLDTDTGGGDSSGSDGSDTEPGPDTWNDESELGLDYLEGGAAAIFAPDKKTFSSEPWPSDRFRQGSRIDVQRFPRPFFNDLLETYVSYAEEVLDGWGRNGSVYFPLEGLLDPASLPASAEASRGARSSLQLLDASPSSPTYGQAFPLVWRQVEKGSDPYYGESTLVVRPVYGFPLADARTYCAILTREARDLDGKHLASSEAFQAALRDDASLAPLRELLLELPQGPADVAAATCFTTQDATRELREVEAFLVARPTPAVTGARFHQSTTRYHEIRARYVSPNFQSGQKPYSSAGGDLRFDAAGKPIVAEEESLRVRLLVPVDREMPPQGWPVALNSHGTTGDWTSCSSGQGANVVTAGFAMLCIDQPLHGERGVGTYNELDSFNFINPRSGRMSFRQSAIDNMWLSRMVQDRRFDMPAGGVTGFDQAVKLDPENIYFFGHSHGGLAGIITFGVDARIKGGVLSGASGVLVETILRRKDPIDISATLALVLEVSPEQLDTFHPVMSLAQMLVDATDPINYAPYWFDPQTGGKPKHVFMTVGTLDDASPAVGAYAVAAAAGMPIVGPQGEASEAHTLAGLQLAQAPVSLNVTAVDGTKVTAGLRQFVGGDHFVAYRDATALAMWSNFYRSIVSTGVPSLTETTP